MRRTITFLATAAFALSLSGFANAKAICRNDKGHFMKCAAAAPATPMAPSKPMASSAPMATAGGAPNCKKGKPCGHSCIAMAKVCHK